MTVDEVNFWAISTWPYVETVLTSVDLRGLGMLETPPGTLGGRSYLGGRAMRQSFYSGYPGLGHVIRPS
jgi:hypothetical protein